MRTRLLAMLGLALCAAAAAVAHPHPDSAAGESAPPGARSHGFERFLGHGRLGVQLQDMTPELRTYLRAPEDRGVLVVRVNSGSAAEKAGLRVGDVIVSVGGKPVDGTPEIIHAVMSAEQDAKLALEVVRDGKTRALEATLAGEPAFAADPMRWMERHMPELRESLEQRMRELEERMQELEQRLREASPTPDELDT